MGNKTLMRLVILAAVVAVLGGGSYALWAYQVDRMAHGIVVRADRAAEEGKYAEAERLYSDHLANEPNDVAVQIKLAEVLLKQEKSSQRSSQALAIFDGILARYPARDDVRRRAAELAEEMGQTLKARDYLAILLERSSLADDGHLEYLMGRCRERLEEFDRAAEYYREAIEHNAPERIEAAQQLAMLSRDPKKLNKPKDAKKIIDEMVKSAPQDYRAYLARGRYYNRFKRSPVDDPTGNKADLRAVMDDFQKALELAPKGRPEIYLEVARAAERLEGGDSDLATPEQREKGFDAARKVLFDQGLEAAPKSPELYVALAELERRAGRVEESIKAMELGMKTLPEDLNLRFMLAMFLASRGESESGRLLLQIVDLERMGVSPLFTKYLTAYYHYNKREFARAKEMLGSLQTDMARHASPDLKAKINLLLAQCHAALGEDAEHQEAMIKALAANQNDPMTRLGWIEALIKRGDLDSALREYQSLAAEAPGVARMPLASTLAELLIVRARRLETSTRWEAPRKLVGDLKNARRLDIEPQLLEARLKLEMGDEEGGIDELQTMRKQFPKDPRPWALEADWKMDPATARSPSERPRRLAEAERALQEAGKQLGDTADLRLARMRMAVARGGIQVVTALNELGRGVEKFSRPERIAILETLARHLTGQQDLKGAAAALERLAAEDPQSLRHWVELFELLLRSGDADRAEAQLDPIAKIDRKFADLCRADLMIVRARGAADAAAKEKARAEARELLEALKKRHPDWPLPPLALARLDREELAEIGKDEERKREKRDAAIAEYRRALELGTGDPVVMRDLVQLLFEAGRGGEALEFYSKSRAPVFAGQLNRLAYETARQNRDYEQAEEIARNAVKSNPKDFQARLWLYAVLMDRGRSDEAGRVLRDAVNDARDEPDRWVTLVRFLVLTRQFDRAEQVVREAEPFLADAPVAMATCCGLVGKIYELSSPDRAKAWYDQALGCFARAQAALKDPGDLSVRRKLAEFLLQTNRSAEAERPLKEVLAATAAGKSSTLGPWARRSLAKLYVNSSPPRTAEALALYSGKSGRGDEPDDLRVMAAIHELQGTPEGRRLAIADLDALLSREPGAISDRVRLAHLLEFVGDWPRAREQFREVTVRAEAAQDAETIARRPIYLAQLIEALVRHHQPGDDSDLANARQLVEKFAAISQRDPLAPVILAAEIDKAANQPKAASRRLREAGERQETNTAGRVRLAEVAEKLGLLEVAEELYRRTADEPPSSERNNFPNQARLALFLGRLGRNEKAMDICEKFWNDPSQQIRGAMANASLMILCNPDVPVDEKQIRRVLPWFEKSAREAPRPLSYIVGEGSLHDRLGEYDRAEEAYRRAIKINDSDGIASNNLAFLLVLENRPVSEALDLINTAINVRGPLPEYLDTRGMIRVAAGQVRQGIADIDTSFRAAPSPAKCFHMAKAYLRLGEKDAARKVIEAGKSRGLPSGLHRLELAEYKKITGELGVP